MQKQRYLSVLLATVFSFVLLSSCERVILEDEPIPDSERVSFSEDIVPIFRSCTGCHSGAITPDLQNNPYQSLKDGGYINVAQPAQSELYLKLKTSGTHSSKATPVQVQQILQWISQGAKKD
jgi:hypothetical protein